MPMNVLLDDELADYVRQLVSCGQFDSEDAVISTALRLMKERAAKKAEIRRIMLEEASTDPIHLIG